MNRVSAEFFVWACLVTMCLTPIAGASDLHSNRPPEHIRGNVATFREVLKRRGLTELLNLHLQDFPPDGSVNSMLMLRDLRLASSRDRNLSTHHRVAAAKAGNEILKRVIEENPDDQRRLEWLFTLAKSIVYDQAEHLFTSVLYRGGNQEDRRQLVEWTAQSLAYIDQLQVELQEAYRRIDSLSVQEFDRLDRTGFVESVDLLKPRAEYLKLWTQFYNAIGRDNGDGTRSRRLKEINSVLEARPELIETAHKISGVRIQLLLLSGMTHRRLGNLIKARGHLTSALASYDELADATDKKSLTWAATLARLELIRTARDADEIDGALQQLRQWQQFHSADGAQDFGLAVVAALEERAIYRAVKEAARKKGKTNQAQRASQQSWKALQKLAQRSDQHRDKVYAAIADMIGTTGDISGFDPFEQCALIASFMFEGGEFDDAHQTDLQRAVVEGDRFVAAAMPGADMLVAEVLFNTGVAQYRLGNIEDAISRFLVVSRDHRRFADAAQAAKFAVRLSSELHNSAASGQGMQSQLLFRDALEVLLTHYEFDEESQYWRFFYANLLAEMGEYDRAAAEFRLVDESHEHHVASVFYRARCIALALIEEIENQTGDQLAVRRRADEFFTVKGRFVELALRVMARDPESAKRDHLPDLLARLTVLNGEVQILDGVGRYHAALESLSSFENDHASNADLVGRVWRVRLVAFERLGRLDEAVRSVPEYVSADPASAGPSLQSLYVACVEARQRAEKAGDTEAAAQQARLALVLARQIVEWADKYALSDATIDRRVLRVQLAEAQLEAGNLEEAHNQLQSDEHARTGAPTGDRATDMRVSYGIGESLFRMEQFEQALPVFNKLAQALPPSESLRWKALLRDLQCRTELDEPASGIIQVIEQQRYLYKSLGGKESAAQFETLLLQNKRRADSSFRR